MSAAGVGASACYSAGSGSGPPTSNFYYPVGLAVSTATTTSAGDPEKPGDVLYVVNSDFDLQYNGGTLQSYDLNNLRQDTAALIAQNLVPGAPEAGIPYVFGPAPCAGASNLDPAIMSNGQRIRFGFGCAPPVDSTQPQYFIRSAVIGAFATDLQLSPDGHRVYAPVRGDATITWAQLEGAQFDCGQDQNGGRCGGKYLVGNVVDPADTRAITMPGEPFGMAQTQDGTAIAVTQQATQETSLLLSGYGASGAAALAPLAVPQPSMQFVLEGVPPGGNGIVAVPHDPDAVRRCEDPAVGDTFPCVRPAFLETSRLAGEIDLLRYYDDEGSGLHSADPEGGIEPMLRMPSLRRPFLEREAAFPVTVNLPGTDQRGIVIDETPRLTCKAQAKLSGLAGDALVAQIQMCGQVPARVFIGSRSPASVIYGTLGGPSLSGDGTYDPDQLRLISSVPLDPDFGVSRLYLAPVVDPTGHYALRLFVVCYDSASVFVFDPDQIEHLGANARAEAVLSTGRGPFAMAFDPFCTGLVDASGNASKSVLPCDQYGPFADVAVSEVAELSALANAAGQADFLVPPDPKPGGAARGLRTFRFGYLALFTDSFLQVIDLDDSLLPPPSASPAAGMAPRSQETFEAVVFTFGNPTPPKGS